MPDQPIHQARFTLRPHHLALLRHANVCWQGGEYGAPAIDRKRPYGNSDVEADVLEILGMTPAADDGEDPCWSRAQREWAAAVHGETATALQIVLACGAFESGDYVMGERYDYTTWRRA